MKKLLAYILILVFSISIFAGCKTRTKFEDNEATLNIYALEAGYGVKFLPKYKELFEKQNPGVTVNYKSSTDAFIKFVEDIKLGPKKNIYDLYFAPNFNYQVVMEQTEIPGYEEIYEDLSDIYETKIPGEEVTISEKLYNGIEQSAIYKGKKFFVPWAGGTSGLVYNADYIGEKEVPRTTKQLMNVVSKSYVDADNNKVYGMITSENGHGYWEYLGDTWWAQLEGVKKYREFYTLGDGSAITVDPYYQDGFRRNFEILEELINKSNFYPKCRTMPHTQAQMYFLEGKVAMMPCGNWLEAEMSQNFVGEKMNFKMMRTPIISDIANPDKLNLSGNTDEEREAKLVEIIDYVDGGEKGAKPENVTDKQIEVIRNARNIIYDVGLNHLLLIPSYSNVVGLAKKFIQMMATDEGIKIFVESTQTTTAYRYDYSSYKGSTLYQSCVDIYKADAEHFCSNGYAIPERCANSFNKFNFNIHAYRDLQQGATTAKTLVDGEIAYAEKTITSWGY